MCNIDRELVLRGAAYFATYAQERDPPKMDPFTARLIEQALRAKLNGHATLPTTALASAESPPGGDLAKAEAAILRDRRPGGTVPNPVLVRAVAIMQTAPEQRFTAKDLLYRAAGPKSYYEAFRKGLEGLLLLHVVARPERGFWKLGPKGAPVS